MLRSDLDAEIGRLLGDPSHTRWTTDILHTREDLAQEEVQALTGAVKTTESLTPTAETAEVTIDDDTLDVARVTYTESDGTIHPLDGKSREEMDFYYPNWENWTSDLPTHFSFDGSNRQIILIPKPSAAYVSAGCLKAWEVRKPQAMSTDASEPFDSNVLMRAYHMSVVHWVTAQCFQDNGDPESLAKSKFHKSGEILVPGEYEKVLKIINAKFDSPVSIPARVMWKPEGGRLGGHQVSKAYPFS